MLTEPALLTDPPPRVDGDAEAKCADPGRCPSCGVELPAAFRDRAYAAARRALAGAFERRLATRLAALERDFAAKRADLVREVALETRALLTEGRQTP